MSNLAIRTIESSYKQVLNIGIEATPDSTLTSALSVITDGIGTPSSLSISTANNGAKVTGSLTVTGPIIIPLGSSAAPSITFAGDIDTGIFSIGTNQVSIAAGGIRAANFAYNAGVGELDVSGNIKASGTISATGNITSSANIIAYTTSDRKFKDNIVNITDPLYKVSQINGVSFDWNDKQSTFSGHDIGVIAQEIEAVLPEIVATREDSSKAVKYEKIVALLIECVKELKAEIEGLKLLIK